MKKYVIKHNYSGSFEVDFSNNFYFKVIKVNKMQYRINCYVFNSESITRLGKLLVTSNYGVQEYPMFNIEKIILDNVSSLHDKIAFPKLHKDLDMILSMPFHNIIANGKRNTLHRHIKIIERELHTLNHEQKTARSSYTSRVRKIRDLKVNLRMLGQKLHFSK